MNDVTVLIPARNAARTVGSAVRSALRDGVAEVLLVDDGSSDGTAEVARAAGGARLRVVPGEGRGIARALNAGLAEIRTAFVARLDADDAILPGRLGPQADLLREHRNVVAVSSGCRAADPWGRPVADFATEGPAREVTGRLRAGDPLVSFCTWLTRTEALRGIGGAREWFETAEDLDLQFRLAEAGRVWHLPVPGYLWRIHGRSITHARSAARREFFDAAARSFARERFLTGSDALGRGLPPEAPAAAQGRGHGQAAGGHIARLATGAAWRHLEAGRPGQALHSAALAVKWSPGSPATWRTMAGVSLRAGLRVTRARQAPSLVFDQPAFPAGGAA